MKIGKILLLCLATNLWLEPALTMNGHLKKEDDSYLTALFFHNVMEIISNKLSLNDWLKLSSLSKWWRITIEQKFEFLVNESFAIKKKDNPLNKFSYKEIYLFPQIALKMGKWGSEQANMLTGEIYPHLVALLIKNLESKILAKSSKIIISHDKDLVLFLSAHVGVNLNVLSTAAYEVANATVDDAAFYPSINIGRQAVQKEYCKADCVAAGKAIRFASIFFPIYALGPAQIDAQEKAKGPVKNALYKFKPQMNDDKQIGACAWQLSLLYLLAHMAQDDFIENHLINGYNNSKKSLSIEKVINLSINQTLENYKSLLDGDLKNNPYIVSLINMAKIIEGEISAVNNKLS